MLRKTDFGVSKPGFARQWIVGKPHGHPSLLQLMKRHENADRVIAIAAQFNFGILQYSPDKNFVLGHSIRGLDRPEDEAGHARGE